MAEVVEELRRVGAGLGMVLMGLAVALVNGLALLAVVIALMDPVAGPPPMVEAAMTGGAGVVHSVTSTAMATRAPDPSAMVAAMARAHPIPFTILLGLGVLANVLSLAGKVYCLSIPSAAGASQFIMMAVACGGIGLALSIAGQVPDTGELAGDFLRTSPLFTMAGFLFYLRFLRRLAAYLGSAPLLVRAIRVQNLTIALMVTVLVTIIGGELGLSGTVTAIVLIGLVIGSLVVFFLYVRLIRSLQRTTNAAVETAMVD